MVALGERDCSVQRRHQKIVEETPSPGVSPELRRRMLAAAVRAGEAVAYKGAGTVECLVDPIRQDFVFLEMNTRLQVEHPVTELVTRVDLVEQQLLIAAGKPVSFTDAEPIGHAIEFRVYAEDPKRFLPGPGQIKVWVEPEGADIRVDAGYAEGNTVTPFYDPLMAKLCVFGVDREAALARAREAVAAFQIEGPSRTFRSSSSCSTIRSSQRAGTTPASSTGCVRRSSPWPGKIPSQCCENCERSRCGRGPRGNGRQRLEDRCG